MKKPILNLALLVSLIILGIQAFSQTSNSSKIVLPVSEYNNLKAKGQLNPNVKYYTTGVNPAIALPSGNNQNNIQMKHNRGGGGPLPCSCLATIDSTFTIAPFTDGTPPDYRSDDGSTPAIPIPFNFCLYGTTYNHFFINCNGNVTLDTTNGAWGSSLFPFQGSIMLAPFWGDVYTLNAASGLVYYKVTPTYAIIQWNQVGYYGMGTVLLNTFQVTITNGSDPILPPGNNLAFCYGDMQWTTGSDGGNDGNGFGTYTQANVGINNGDGINSIEFGMFTHAGTDYAGGSSINNGVSYLDNQSFYGNFCSGTNMPPVPNGLTNCDTVKMCGLGDTLYITQQFLAPEAGQNTNVSVSLNGMAGVTVISNSSGNTATVIIRIISSAANAGNNTITFIAIDDGTPIGSTTINAVINIDTTNTTTLQPVITGTLGFCPGDSTMLSVSPTTYDSYVWSNNSSNTSINVNTSQLVFVTASLNGCSKSTSVNVIQQPIPTPAIGGYPYTCHNSGNFTTLYSVPDNYSVYHWSNTSSTDSIIVGDGTFTLTVTDSFGCVGSTTLAVTSISNNIPTTLNGNVITANINNVTYQWIDCNHGDSAIIAATNQSFTATANGNYAVVVSNGFCNDTSACVAITTATGINTITNDAGQFTISPNPFTEQTTITFSQIQNNTSVKIMDVLGKEIKSLLLNGTNNVILEKGDLANGIYFVQVTFENKTVANRKIVIQ